jgi:hypothetical protein
VPQPTTLHKEKYRVKIFKKFAALGNLHDGVDINGDWETNFSL